MSLALLCSGCGNDPPATDVSTEDTSDDPASPSTEVELGDGALDGGSLDDDSNTGATSEVEVPTSDEAVSLDASAPTDTASDSSLARDASAEPTASDETDLPELSDASANTSEDVQTDDATQTPSDSADAMTPPPGEPDDPTEPDPPIPSGTPLVMILIDGSSGVFAGGLNGGSLPFDELPDVWEAMRTTLQLMAQHDEAKYWPLIYASTAQNACPELLYGAAPLASAAALASVMAPSAETVSDTKREGPLADAMAVGLGALAVYPHDGPKYLLVLTDGPPGDTCTKLDAPSCGKDAVFGHAQDAYAQGIQTRMINFGGAASEAFAEDVSHAGDGQLVIPVPDAEVYCLHDEATTRGEPLPTDTASLEAYYLAGGWREHALASYADAGHTYAESLAHHPTTVAELEASVEAYLSWVVAP